MKNIVAAGLMSMIILTACKKDDQIAEKSLEQQKIEFQARQLEIEKQKLAIEKEKMAYEAQKKTDSVAEAKTLAANKTQPKVIRETKTVYVNNTPNSSNTASSGTTATATQKKGMSKAAKGAIIGTVGGAAAGAIISKKNRGAGAVVGGIVGGTGGYVIGRSQDKKDGRVK